jgi:GT2 family glycosyltransferase
LPEKLRLAARRIDESQSGKKPPMPISNAKIRVVIITCNCRDEVLQTLQHTLNPPERPAVVMVDNASTDGTAHAVQQRFPQVHTISVDRNLGAAARTLGVREATTPYVALSDDDTHWQAGALRSAAELFDTHARLAILKARMLVGSYGREDPTCAQMAQSPLPFCPELPGKPLLGFLAGASAIRRSAFLDVGGFEPRFFLGGEEALLAADLAARGWCLRYVPDLVVRHYPSLRRDGANRRWHLIRNALWFAWLRRPFGSAVRRTITVAGAGEWDRTKLRGIAAAAAGLAGVLRRRRVLPAEVEGGLRLLEQHSES